MDIPEHTLSPHHPTYVRDRSWKVLPVAFKPHFLLAECIQHQNKLYFPGSNQYPAWLALSGL